MALNRWKRRVSGFCLLTVCLTVSMSPVYAGTPEHVSIQTLLSPQAASYQRHLVTLQGVAREIEITPPYRLPKCGRLLYGQATFMLDDATGSLPVDVFGSCLGPQAIDALPQNGNLVRVTAVIQVLTTDPPRRVRARVTEMQILDPKRSP
jgi:hypothetical protein